MPRDYEVLADYTLDPDVERDLLASQSECTFIWNTKDGSPLGVIMSFVFADGHFWLTASAQRGRVSAVQRDPRVAIVVTSKGSEMAQGKSLTYKGTCAVRDDEQTKRWFYAALGQKRFPDDDAYRETFVKTLDSPRRVILEVTPGHRIGIDLAKMHRGAQQYEDE